MSPEPASDTALLERFRRRRDEASFRALHAAVADGLWRFLARLLPRDDVEDAYQETWRRAVEGLDGFRGGSRAATWLGGIALNCARERLRAAGREAGRAALEPEELAAPAEGGGEAAAPFDGVPEGALEAAIAALPLGYRAVLLLHDVEGHTHREIAAALEIEVGTSKSQLARARRALRRALARPAAQTPEDAPWNAR